MRQRCCAPISPKVSVRILFLMKTTRRLFALLLLFSAPLLFSSLAQTPEKPAAKGQYIAYVGTYTAKSSSKGIYAYWFDPKKGQLTSIGVVAETPDPSFLAVHPSGKYLYAVNEIGNFNGEVSGAVSAFAIDAKTGGLKLLNQVPTRGAGPCHVSLDKTGAFVLVANYDSGSIASFPVQGDGSLGTASGYVQHSGSGPDKERQEGPHAHWIGTSPDNRFALAVDLGLDQVIVYGFDSSKGHFHADAIRFCESKTRLRTAPSCFSSQWEIRLRAQRNGIRGDRFLLSSQERLFFNRCKPYPRCRSDYSGPKEAAEIAVHPSGKFLYTSNRGHDSIAVFAIDHEEGDTEISRTGFDRRQNASSFRN